MCCYYGLDCFGALRIIFRDVAGREVFSAVNHLDLCPGVQRRMWIFAWNFHITLYIWFGIWLAYYGSHHYNWTGWTQKLAQNGVFGLFSALYRISLRDLSSEWSLRSAIVCLWCIVRENVVEPHFRRDSIQMAAAAQAPLDAHAPIVVQRRTFHGLAQWFLLGDIL